MAHVLLSSVLPQRSGDMIERGLQSMVAVTMLAEGTEEQILKLVKAIDITEENGPQVHKIERSNVKGGDYGAFKSFSIEH